MYIYSLNAHWSSATLFLIHIIIKLLYLIKWGWAAILVLYSGHRLYQHRHWKTHIGQPQAYLLIKKTITLSEASDGFLSRAAGAKRSDIPQPYPVQPVVTCAGESVCGSGACKRTQPAPAPWCIPWSPRRPDPRGRSWSCSEKPPLHLRRRRERETAERTGGWGGREKGISTKHFRNHKKLTARTLDGADGPDTSRDSRRWSDQIEEIFQCSFITKQDRDNNDNNTCL